uniref:Reverse transcriptase domain-containing protein n=1 Tax=Sipha flava TaxID=143950 RepID=A0A2S2QJ96_9HEMI
MIKMLNTLEDIFDKYQLKINGQKTKKMLISKINSKNEVNIKLRNNHIQQVNEFCFLGSLIMNRNQVTADIKRRIALAKQVFLKKYNIFSNRHLKLKTRKNVIKTFVWSVLCYRCET